MHCSLVVIYGQSLTHMMSPAPGESCWHHVAMHTLERKGGQGRRTWLEHGETWTVKFWLREVNIRLYWCVSY